MSLLLKHTPGEWDGTFAFTAQAMITNLLDDGPIEITVNGGSPRMLIRYDAGTLVFEDGEENLFDGDIATIEVQ